MSAILSADDLNDFISPGVACIKPVETFSLPTPPPSSSASSVTFEHEVIRDDGAAAAAAAAAGPAQISLTDCLACSGCVTSAEAVLVSLQSHAEVLRALDAAPGLQLVRGENQERPSSSAATAMDGLHDPSRRLFVASVSPQTRANLAAACGPGVSERQAGRMLERLFSGPRGLRAGGLFHNGFTWVVDTNAAREATLVLGADEVLGRGVSPSPSTPSSPPPPILASACPGWVCYAEKTHPHVLGHLSRVKSPQALTGTLLKSTLSRTLGIPPDRIWHVAVMPCFDKKLEASRAELTNAAWAGAAAEGAAAVRDVDCVITSKEVLMLAASRGIDIFDLLSETDDDDDDDGERPPFPDPVLDDFFFPSGRRQRRPPLPAAGTSGGNLFFVLQTVLAQNPGAVLQTNRGRNADVVEYVIQAAGDAASKGLDQQQAPVVLFKAARYYGFRNIQNLVRRLRPARPSRLPGGRAVGRGVGRGGSAASMDFAYVEVMACPGGCTNGGGQIKVDDDVVVARRGASIAAGPQEQKAWLAQVDEAYYSADEAEHSREAADDTAADAAADADYVAGISPSYVRKVMTHWAAITGVSLSDLAYTTFREVVSDVGKAKNGNATERVVQLAGKIGGGW